MCNHVKSTLLDNKLTTLQFLECSHLSKYIHGNTILSCYACSSASVLLLYWDSWLYHVPPAFLLGRRSNRFYLTAQTIPYLGLSINSRMFAMMKLPNHAFLRTVVKVIYDWVGFQTLAGPQNSPDIHRSRGWEGQLRLGCSTRWNMQRPELRADYTKPVPVSMCGIWNWEQAWQGNLVNFPTRLQLLLVSTTARAEGRPSQARLQYSWAFVSAGLKLVRPRKARAPRGVPEARWDVGMIKAKANMCKNQGCE